MDPFAMCDKSTRSGLRLGLACSDPYGVVCCLDPACDKLFVSLSDMNRVYNVQVSM